jgi:hypothetical protein
VGPRLPAQLIEAHGLVVDRAGRRVSAARQVRWDLAMLQQSQRLLLPTTGAASALLLLRGAARPEHAPRVLVRVGGRKGAMTRGSTGEVTRCMPGPCRPAERHTPCLPSRPSPPGSAPSPRAPPAPHSPARAAGTPRGHVTHDSRDARTPSRNPGAERMGPWRTSAASPWTASRKFVRTLFTSVWASATPSSCRGHAAAVRAVPHALDPARLRTRATLRRAGQSRPKPPFARVGAFGSCVRAYHRCA